MASFMILTTHFEETYFFKIITKRRGSIQGIIYEIWAGVAQLVELLAFQAGCREFESRLPLQIEYRLH